jgi:ABC-2 type transport system ATP-binding protein
MQTLRVENIGFSYADEIVFERASFNAESCKITGLLGGNGAGKTTFFDLICGLRHPSSGNIHLQANEILYLSQVLTAPASLSMGDLAAMTIALASQANIKMSDILARLSSWDVQISKRYSGLLAKKSSLCSYGQKRLFFTLTLVALQGELIILDEPTAGVDSENRFYIWECLRKAASGEAAIIVSSHDINEIAYNCDGFYMINHGCFNHFDSGQQFAARYGAQTLDQAFINAVRE